jgi:pimeloyl-ACP methyl ester carboxylesterase
MIRAISTLLEDDTLLLRFLPGAARRLVVVFTGFPDLPNGERTDEFVGSASADGENNVLFVTDRKGGWYSTEGLWTRIVGVIREVLEQRDIRELITLGVSMGGYGALLLPRDLRVRRAVAFAPQVTLDRDLVDDDRWPSIDNPPERDLPATMRRSRTQYTVAAGVGNALDIAHLDLLPDYGRVHRYLLPTRRHNVAAALKEAGLLAPVVGAALLGRRARLERLLVRFGEVAA